MLKKPLHIAFIGRNNLVRSPIASFMFFDQLRRRGIHNELVKISDAGTFSEPQWRAAIRMRLASMVSRVLISHGYHRTNGQRPTRLNRYHLGADLIVAMDRGQVATLTQLNVPAERIRLLRSFDAVVQRSGTPAPDLAEPSYRDDLDEIDEIDRVVDVIAAALPGLHVWLDEQLAPWTTIHDVADAWRVWYTKPAEDPLTLYSPTYGDTAQGRRREHCRTRDRFMNAVCATRAHEPASQLNCPCGVYGAANVIDSLYLLRVMTRNLRGWSNRTKWPQDPRLGMVPILTRVILNRARIEDEFSFVSMLDKYRSCGVHKIYLRAASLQIVRIFVTPELIGTRKARQLADRLAISFDVETIAGFPEYTTRDWDGRPEWMRTEPSRSQELVDQMLSCFTRIGTLQPLPHLEPGEQFEAVKIVQRVTR